MNLELRDYQRKCISQISDLLAIGKKHFSIAMTVGLGNKYTALFLVQSLIQENKKVAMVCKHNLVKQQLEMLAQNLEIESQVDFFTVHAFCNENLNTKFVVFCDLDVHDRRVISTRLQSEEVITFSFFTLGQGSSHESNPASVELNKFAENMPPIVYVCITEKNLDIRDIRYSDMEESPFVWRNVVEDSNWLQQEREATSKERNEILNRSKYLQVWLNDTKQAHEHKPFSGLPEPDLDKLRELIQNEPDLDKLRELEKDRQVSELKSKIKRCEEQIKEKNAIIAQQDQMLAFQQSLLSQFGIKPEVLQNSFEKIQEYRSSLMVDLESDNGSTKELALKKLQDLVSEEIARMMQNAFPATDRSYYEEYLIGELSKDVWKRMDEKSRSFLVTAKATYEGMIKTKEKDSFDYSGVCLLITKALEVETAKRFFHSYKNYLNRKYQSVWSWPYALRQRDNQGLITDKVISDDDFTLGSVVSVSGYRRVFDEYGGCCGFTPSIPSEKNVFLEYAGNILFHSASIQKTKMEIEKDLHFIEKVRLDYRNPAAHRDSLSMTSAKECMEYVIDVQHMLKDMLSVMKI